jgi:hypothetical protein
MSAIGVIRLPYETHQVANRKGRVAFISAIQAQENQPLGEVPPMAAAGGYASQDAADALLQLQSVKVAAKQEVAEGNPCSTTTGMRSRVSHTAKGGNTMKSTSAAGWFLS